MKKNELAEDTLALLEEVLVTEANQEVGKIFERAWGLLDPESQRLLNEYFDGSSTNEMARSRDLTEPQVVAWIEKTKKELVQSLRVQFQPRQ